MCREPHNDPRAAHKVYVLPTGTNVKFFHKGYEISLAADGQETMVFDAKGVQLFQVEGTSAKSVCACVDWIDAR